MDFYKNIFKKLYYILFIFLINISQLCYSENKENFVLLKSAKINMRYGPGTIYPIKWIYIKKGMPLKVLDEFDGWFYVQDIDGESGWIMNSFLVKKHINSIVKKTAPIKKSKNKKSKIIFYIEKFFIIKIKECIKDVCKIEANKKSGWIEKKYIWAIPKFIDKK